MGFDSKKMFSVEGKTCIVTGGAQGLSRGMAEGLLENGAHVVLMDLQAEKLEAVVKEYQNKGYKAYGVAGDLSKKPEIDRMFDEAMKLLGDRLDVMIPAAGIQRRYEPWEFPEDMWRLVIEVNLNHVWFMCQKAIQVMRDKETVGKIINIASMSLNASLAGLVAITAGCDVTDAFGSIIIGAVAGLLVVFGVWLLDYVLRIDDPVGAVAVHCLNGIWGTIAVGLFATTAAPGNEEFTGLFYGGGFGLLSKQLIGMVCVIAWTAVTITITFLVIKAIFGLRVTEEEEIVGLDATEHGLPSAYAGFSMMDISNTMIMEENEYTQLGSDTQLSSESGAAAESSIYVHHEEVQRAIKEVSAGSGIYKVVIIAKLARYDVLRKAMNNIGVTGMTVTQVMGCGIQKGAG